MNNILLIVLINLYVVQIVYYHICENHKHYKKKSRCSNCPHYNETYCKNKTTLNVLSFILCLYVTGLCIYYKRPASTDIGSPFTILLIGWITSVIWWQTSNRKSRAKTFRNYFITYFTFAVINYFHNIYFVVQRIKALNNPQPTMTFN